MKLIGFLTNHLLIFTTHFDILIEHAGANTSLQDSFVYSLKDVLQSSGFGGKYYQREKWGKLLAYLNIIVHEWLTQYLVLGIFGS